MTETVKHTPGPWSSTYNEHRGTCQIHADNGTWVATTRDGTIKQEANARLIAAAPEMLAVIAKACAIFDLNHEGGDEYNGDLSSDLWKAGIHEKLTAAIAKARHP